MEDTSDERKTRNAVEREVSVFLDNLKLALYRPDSLNMDVNLIRAEGWLNQSHQYAINLINTNPLDYWDSSLKEKYRLVITKIIKLQKTHLTFLKLSNDLEYIIQEEGKPAIGNFSVHILASFKMYCLCKINGSDYEEINAWLNGKVFFHGDPTDFFSKYNQVSIKLQSKAADYLDQKNKLITEFTILKADLIDGHY
ncbi:hypothetical protein [Paenibacillus sedimenti]|uniref:Uncharacterized protein n=1 Tax=Paenibacillus sedimenti TaxID=2770274 RepID=A0A926KNT4_9BACL|nr:hypothetical protein [Paenibacillus sedimenti]MBD0381259.1 hypothetical protein [Paenibacillus sedimenti]